MRRIVTFIVSKVAWLMLTPSNLLLLLALAGVLLALAGRGWGLGLALLGLGCMALATILPLGAWLAAPLEDRFPFPRPAPERVDGIVVLGGGVDPFVTAARGQPAIGATGERFTALIELARRYPLARLAFTGGVGRLAGAPMSEAEIMRRFYAAQGLAVERVIFEARARTTRENALFSRALLHPAAGERWLLVTSAMHMPRAMGVFAAIGWPVEPWPVDYRTTGPMEWRFAPKAADRLSQLDDAAYEWLALAYYRLLGWTSRLFPAPRDVLG
jgi:uncharacterized SAM-binding protein YcdF (DUF218 family)